MFDLFSYSLISYMAFPVTIIIEFLVYLIVIRKNVKEIALYAILINAFTWPLASLFYGNFESLLMVEFFVFVVEFVLIMLLFKMKWWKALIISLVANVVTAILGIFWLFL